MVGVHGGDEVNLIGLRGSLSGGLPSSGSFGIRGTAQFSFEGTNRSEFNPSPIGEVGDSNQRARKTLDDL